MEATDYDVQQTVLRHLYAKRLDGPIPIANIRRGHQPVTGVEFPRFDYAAQQLHEMGLVKYERMLNGGGYISITPKGVNEVEEVRQTTNSQINNVTHNNTINSSGESSVANIGDNNQSTINIATAIGELVQNIEAADASEDEKEEAKTLLNRAIKNPLIGNLLGGAISGLTSGALT